MPCQRVYSVPPFRQGYPCNLISIEHLDIVILPVFARMLVFSYPKTGQWKVES